MINFSRILFLGCHLDDIEFGCGGLLSRLWSCGNDKPQTLLVVLSHENRDANDLVCLQRDTSEAFRAVRMLGGCPESQLRIMDIPGQKFQYHPQEIREILLSIRSEYRPDMILFPAKGDIHQDHNVLWEEAMRIYRNASCAGYEILRSNLSFSPNLFVHLSEEDVGRKAYAVSCYRSQLVQSAGFYFDKDVVFGNARSNGVRCGSQFAEAYEIYSWQVTV